MKGFATLFKRQLMSYFLAPGSYVLMAVFLIVSGMNFRGMIFRSLREHVEIGDILFGSSLFWVAVLAAITLITMRLFAEEKRSGSIELLLTAPVTDTQVVMAKYLGAFVFFIVLSAPTFFNALVIMLLNKETSSFDMPAIITGYLMFYFTGGCYIAFGLFVSSLTRSQAVAGMLCFAGLCLACFAESWQGIIPGKHTGSISEYISGIRHVLYFAAGIADIRPMVLYLSCAAFFLFATVKVIEARQWK